MARQFTNQERDLETGVRTSNERFLSDQEDDDDDLSFTNEPSIEQSSVAGLRSGARRSPFISRLLSALENRKLILYSLVVIIALIIIISIASSNRSSNRSPPKQNEPPSTNPPPSKDNRLRFTFEKSQDYEFYAESAHVDWIDHDVDGAYITKSASGSIMVRFIDNSHEDIVLATNEDLNQANHATFRYSKYFVSQKLDYILFMINYEKGWRHSFFGDYHLYNTNTKTLAPLATSSSNKTITGELGSGKISMAKWSPLGNHIAWVRDNDLYLMLNGKTEVQITADGSKNIINGVSDWVYEEEVLESHDALWFSPDDRYVAYIKSDDSKVNEYPLQFFERNDHQQYPQVIDLKYPKPGTPNPEVSLHIVDIDSQGHSLSSPVVLKNFPFPTNGFIFSEVVWLSTSTLLVRIMNRVQDQQAIYIVQPEASSTGALSWKGVLVRKESNADGAWYSKLQPVYPHPRPSKSSYYELQEVEGYMHVVYYANAQDASPSEIITFGSWEVTSIDGFDEKHQIMFITSTEIDSRERHLYAIDLKTKTRTCLTDYQIEAERLLSYLDFGDWSSPKAKTLSKSGFYEAKFSAKSSFYLLNYKGPGVPFSRIYRVSDSSNPIASLTENRPLVETLRKYRLPYIAYTAIKNGNGDDMNVKLILPPEFLGNASKKYPVLMQVYGGPNSQMVQTKYGLDHMNAFADEGVIIAIVDGRGTGFKGRKYRSWVSKRLGKFEVEDQVSAARFLASLPYIDGSRIGIWGWSYGGFMACKVLESGADVFSLGMAVAPVTDWMLYDSVYTERYMKTPAENENGYLNSAVREMDGFKNKHFLLVHGLSDDNVHFQNSADLIWRLTQAGVQSYRVQVYTDSDHSMSAGRADTEIYALLRNFLMTKYGILKLSFFKRALDYIRL